MNVELSNVIVEIDLNMGAQGIQGKQGIQGIQGPTGDTYVLTETDKQEIAQITSSDATNLFNQNAADKLEQFNSNYDEKTNTFNTIVKVANDSIEAYGTTKISEFETFATDKTALFNENYNEKIDSLNNISNSKLTTFEEKIDEYIDSYNDNATEKTTSFNNNATEMLETYNNNAESKTTDYNTNATNKVKEYNDNATIKTKEFNTNVENQTNTFNANATNKLNAYNTNAETKLNEYNSNAETKLSEFNANADSYGNRITVNENNIVDINSSMDTIVPKNSASGVPIYVDDALPYKVFNYGASGNYKQETTEGKQLFNYEDTVRVTSGIVVDNDGWITIAHDNTTGTEAYYMNYFTNNLNLNVSTSYKVVMEIKEISGQGRISAVSPQTTSQINTEMYNDFENLKPNTIIMQNVITKDNFNDSSYGLRTFASFDIGDIGSITFRLSVLEDTSVTEDTFVYEKYTGEQPSPNSNYPQEIDVIEGDVSYISVGNNRFNSFAITTENITNDTDGTLVIEGVETSNGYASTEKTLKEICPSLKVGDVAYLYIESDYYEANATLPKTQIYIHNENVTWRNNNSLTITEKMLNGLVVVYGGYNTTSHIKIMITKDTPSSNYITPMFKIVPIDLKGNFVGELPNEVTDRLLYKDRHIYLEKNVSKVILDGSSDEQWNLDSSTLTNTNRFRLVNASVDIEVSSSYLPSMCTHFINDNEGNTYNKDNEHYYIGSGGSYFFVNKTVAPTLEEWKAWLSENKPEIYYQPASPELIDLGEYDLSTFEGTNNISLLANLEPSDMNITYALDLKKYTDKKIASLSSQIL